MNLQGFPRAWAYRFKFPCHCFGHNNSDSFYGVTEMSLLQGCDVAWGCATQPMSAHGAIRTSERKPKGRRV
jgi:hypothetical protein